MAASYQIVGRCLRRKSMKAFIAILIVVTSLLATPEKQSAHDVYEVETAIVESYSDNVK